MLINNPSFYPNSDNQHYFVGTRKLIGPKSWLYNHKKDAVWRSIAVIWVKCFLRVQESANKHTFMFCIRGSIFAFSEDRQSTYDPVDIEESEVNHNIFSTRAHSHQSSGIKLK